MTKIFNIIITLPFILMLIIPLCVFIAVWLGLLFTKDPSLKEARGVAIVVVSLVIFSVAGYFYDIYYAKPKALTPEESAEVEKARRDIAEYQIRTKIFLSCTDNVLSKKYETETLLKKLEDCNKILGETK